jgi:phage-related protein
LAALVAVGGLTSLGIAVTLMQPGFTALGLAIRGVGTAMTFMTGPWGVAIASVVAGVALIIANWDSIKNWAQQNFGGSIPAILNTLSSVFSTVWNVIEKVVMDAWNYIKPTIMNAVNEIKLFWNAVWPQISLFFTSVWNGMKTTLTGWFTSVKDLLTMFFTDYKAFWTDEWNAIKDALKLAWDTMTDLIKLAWDVISGGMKVFLDLINGNWQQAWNDVKSTVSNVWTDIKTLFSDFITDASNFGTDMVKAIADGIKGGVSWISDALSYVWGQAKSFFSSLGGGGEEERHYGTIEYTNGTGGCSSSGGADGSHALGLNYVPFDGYRAILHQGEMVLTAQQANQVRNEGGYSLGYSGASGVKSSSGAVFNGGINITIQGAGKDGKQIGLDIAAALRQQMKFSL